MSTRRKRIAELLENANDPLTVKDICELLDIKDRSLVEEDLSHIARSVKRKGMRLMASPASCAKCGFVFNSKKAKTPSRCPKCRSEWILPARFIIMS